MVMRLSVVDIDWPGHVRSLVPQLERTGYHRYWTTEHYAARQSSSPTVLAGVAAGLTERIRVGTAGVLAHYAAPLSVVNDFALLELLHPGRIDMGLAGSTGGAVAQAALSETQPTAESYEARLREIVTLRRLSVWSNGDERTDALGPVVSQPPPMWVCGTSLASAKRAARLGCAYAFHAELCSPDTNGVEVLDQYRQNFRPSLFQNEPLALVACFGTLDQAGDDGRRRSFCGPVDRAVEQLEKIAVDHDVEELAIYLTGAEFERKLEGYEAIAEGVGLPSPVRALVGAVDRRTHTELIDGSNATRRLEQEEIRHNIGRGIAQERIADPSGSPEEAGRGHRRDGVELPGPVRLGLPDQHSGHRIR